MIKIALYLGRICEYGLIGLKTIPFSLEMFSYVKYTYSLLGSLKDPTTARIGPRIEALTFTSPALNLRSRSKILASILKVRFDKLKHFVVDVSLDIVLMTILFNDVTVC